MNLSQAFAKVQDVFIPVNMNQNHWVVIHMNITGHVWYIYDSLISSSPKEPLNAAVQVRDLDINDYPTHAHH